MGRLEERLRALRAGGEGALVPFVTGGDPDLETTEALVLAIAEAGADAIEIGVPFSDPLAEGPTVQRASERALAAGASLRRLLELVRRVRPRTEVPLVLMGYANPFYAMGEGGFADAAAEAGVDGLIVPDLPPEEGAGLYAAAAERGIDAVLLAAPTTTPERLRELATRSRGFLYLVSVTGVTGARRALPADLEASVEAVRAVSDVPVCVGFGIGSPEQAAAVGAFADGVVVGSALVERIHRAGSPGAAVDEAGRFVASLKAALPGPSAAAERGAG